MSWPDVELVVIAYLNDTIDGRVVAELPGDLEAQVPLTRVTRGPGSDDKVTDAPLIDVETFTAATDGAGNSLSRAAMWQLAEDTRQALHALAGTVVADALVDTVDTATGPVFVDYGNPAVHRAVASYRLTLRQL